jgi:hypothetical protein
MPFRAFLKRNDITTQLYLNSLDLRYLVKRSCLQIPRDQEFHVYWYRGIVESPDLRSKVVQTLFSGGEGRRSLCSKLLEHQGKNLGVWFKNYEISTSLWVMSFVYVLYINLLWWDSRDAKKGWRMIFQMHWSYHRNIVSMTNRWCDCMGQDLKSVDSTWKMYGPGMFLRWWLL